MKKLAVIGRGSVGCTTVANFIKDTNYEIDWYYDPNIKPTPVGEGTSLMPPVIWYDSGMFGLNDDLYNIESTPKLGIHKQNWGSEGRGFLHPFPFGHLGVHFSGVTFQDYAFNKLIANPRVNPIEANVQPDDVDSDFVMCCSGTPNRVEDDFFTAQGMTVNACLVSQCPWDHPRFDYTITHAMPNGWVFGIPLQTRCSIGYVHNSKFASREQIEKEVAPFLEQMGLEPASQNYLQFNNYYRKQNYTDRVAYNGTASYFLEPIEATSLSHACYINHRAIAMWDKKQLTPQMANEENITTLRSIEAMIAMHYAAGSIYNTDFWKWAQQTGLDRLHAAAAENDLFVANMIKILKHQPNPVERVKFAGTWDVAFSYGVNAEGLGLVPLFQQLDEQYDLGGTDYDWDPDTWKRAS